MDTQNRPTFRQLNRDQCLEILARNHIGRVAYARSNHIDIEPVHYVYADGWLYGRTSKGRKLEMTGYSWWPVAFEVDEVKGLFHWRSVVVHGGFYAISCHGTAAELQEWQHALDLIRTLIPDTFLADDPVPFRTVLFRIAVQEITGREALPPMARGDAETAHHATPAAASTQPDSPAGYAAETVIFTSDQKEMANGH